MSYRQSKLLVRARYPNSRLVIIHGSPLAKPPTPRRGYHICNGWDANTLQPGPSLTGSNPHRSIAAAWIAAANAINPPHAKLQFTPVTKRYPLAERFFKRDRKHEARRNAYAKGWRLN